ncbi:hypothetical protein TNCV_1250141 [Trichonephila clavipes]|nr:hypothetical protein TNCV_1250141 [Trichonephila clavipes]
MRNYLHAICRGTWMLHILGPFSWPSLFQELSPLDFFISGPMKSLGNETPVAIMDDFTARIVIASGDIAIPPNLFELVRQS